MDTSPRSAMVSLCGSGDQNNDSLVTDVTANDSSDDETQTDIELSVVRRSIEKQQHEPEPD